MNPIATKKKHKCESDPESDSSSDSGWEEDNSN